MQSLIFLFVLIIGIIAFINFFKSMLKGLNDDKPKSSKAVDASPPPLQQQPQIIEVKEDVVTSLDTIIAGTGNNIKVGCPFCQTLVDADAKQCPSCNVHFG